MQIIFFIIVLPSFSCLLSRFTGLFPNHNLGQVLALLDCGFVIGVSYGDKYHRLFFRRQLQEVSAQRCIEIAHPASAKSLFGSRQAEVFYGYSDINVTMSLSVGAHPLQLMINGG